MLASCQSLGLFAGPTFSALYSPFHTVWLALIEAKEPANNIIKFFCSWGSNSLIPRSSFYYTRILLINVWLLYINKLNCLDSVVYMFSFTLDPDPATHDPNSLFYYPTSSSLLVLYIAQ